MSESVSTRRRAKEEDSWPTTARQVTGGHVRHIYRKAVGVFLSACYIYCSSSNTDTRPKNNLPLVYRSIYIRTFDRPRYVLLSSGRWGLWEGGAPVRDTDTPATREAGELHCSNQEARTLPCDKTHIGVVGKVEPLGRWGAGQRHSLRDKAESFTEGTGGANPLPCDTTQSPVADRPCFLQYLHRHNRQNSSDHRSR